MTTFPAGSRRGKTAGFRLPFLFVSALAAASASLATSIIPISDAELYRRATLVIHGVVLSNDVTVDGQERPETVTFIRTLAVLKGSLSGTLVLHQLGAALPDGRFLKIWGRPEYEEGTEVIVFAIGRPEGEWQTAEMLLGKFDVQADGTGRRFAVPALAASGGQVDVVSRSAAGEASAPGESLGAKPDFSPRELTAFLAAIRSGSFDGQRTPPEGSLVPVRHPEDGSPVKRPDWSNINSSLYRWSNNATAGWTLIGSANMTGGGAAQATGALATWTNDPNSSIGYTTSSGTSNTIDLNAGTSSGCGWSTCVPASGGVIGCGGPSGVGGSNSFRGDTYSTITQGMVQMRSFCTMDSFSPTIVQSVLTHELGHTLGLGHSEEQNPANTVVSPHDACPGDEDAAIMRWTVQNRTTLGTDDQDAIRWIYGDGSNHCSSTSPTITSLVASPALPRPVGTPITFTATATGGTAPLQYRFWRYSAATGWTMVQDYSAGNTFAWTPSAGGQYDVAVWVRSSGSANAYDAILDTGFFTVTAAATISSLTAVPAPPRSVGTPMVWTATASGSPGPLQYRFWRYSASTGWVIVQDYSNVSTLAWTPSLAGQYDIAVWVRTAGSLNAYDAILDTGFFTITAPVTVSSLTPSPAPPRSVGTRITWTATASGNPTPLQYRFWRYNAASGWTMVQDYSTINTFGWTPSLSGQYDIAVWVKAAGSANPLDATLDTGFFNITP